ncbi:MULTISPECIES: VPLPA-CTERM sorting domain-containing protein [Methylophaga]|uniref:VPLPA-CTERM sorting domain-containing protein n=1 Tax=Methylophaga TaxID=40222 RepID=UPI0023548034|nr:MULTISPECIES: VPLPA-CTERM sorting domain-containing protein [Methylophaga]
MKILKTLAGVALSLFIASSASAAHLSDKVIYATKNKKESTIQHFAGAYQYVSTDGSFSAGTGPDYAYQLNPEATTNSVKQDQLNTAFNAAEASGNYSELVGYDVSDFYSTGSYPAATESTDFFTSDVFSTGYLNTTSLGLTFEGIMIKSGNTTLVALFSDAISELYFKTFIKQGISHIALFNTAPISAVPVPAALWLFAPALLGLVGFRRRQSATK